MTRAEFVDAWRGERVRVDPAGAARLMSARLLLPFVLLPMLGLAVALAAGVIRVEKKEQKGV